jgi:hypothetical protein
MNENRELFEFLQSVFNSMEVLGSESIFWDLENFDYLKEGFFIQEIAGRDSLAALNSFLKTEGGKYHGVILAAAISPTEYGNLEYLYNSLLTAAEICKSKGLRYTFSISKSVFAWKELVAIKTLENSIRYGFYTTCIACHLYLHLLRGLIAVKTGASPIVSGERYFHKGKIKINQSPEAIEAYSKLLKEFGVEIVFPVFDIDDERTILDLLPRFWEEGKEQLKCYFTGTSKLDKDAYLKIKNNLNSYLNDYLIPKGREILNLLLQKA